MWCVRFRAASLDLGGMLNSNASLDLLFAVFFFIDISLKLRGTIMNKFKVSEKIFYMTAQNGLEAAKFF
jgi:hypothetical protein